MRKGSQKNKEKLLKKLSKSSEKLLEKSSLIKGVDTLATQTLINTRELPYIETSEKARYSGHYIDQKLKYNKPSDEPLTLFDSLEETTKKKIDKEYMETITEGIKLGKAEEKILNSILNLLHKKSNIKINDKNKPADPERFYTGNLPTEKITFGGNLLTAPLLRITPHEFFTEVTGSKDYSGKEIKDYNTALTELSSKQYLITYKRHRKILNGKKFETVIDRVEEYLPLFKIIKYYEGLSIEEDKQLDENDNKLSRNRGEIILKLNPLFIDQLDTKFILYPIDINKRTEIASGGSKKVTEAITRLRDYLLRAISNKNYEISINRETLPHILGLDNYIKESRKKLINQRIDESLQAVKNLDLALEIKEVTGANYQPQYQFTLNKDFQ